jgi:hypothetical protein
VSFTLVILFGWVRLCEKNVYLLPNGFQLYFPLVQKWGLGEPFFVYVLNFVFNQFFIDWFFVKNCRDKKSFLWILLFLKIIQSWLCREIYCHVGLWLLPSRLANHSMVRPAHHSLGHFCFEISFPFVINCVKREIQIGVHWI